jgi:phosphoglycolate phosphatase
MSTLFFDLDGTLIDSAVGITRCVAHALRGLGEPVPQESELRRWIGPALRTSFAPLLRDPNRVEQAVALYRERFESQGWSEHVLYPDIADTVTALHAAGYRLAVVTAKNEPHARKILAHHPFARVFEDVVGATADGRLSHKPELIGMARAITACVRSVCCGASAASRSCATRGPPMWRGRPPNCIDCWAEAPQPGRTHPYRPGDARSIRMQDT